MTTGPTDGKVTTPAGGPDGMPLALRLNEGLGLTGRVCMSGETSIEWTSVPGYEVATDIPGRRTVAIILSGSRSARVQWH